MKKVSLILCIVFLSFDIQTQNFYSFLHDTCISKRGIFFSTQGFANSTSLNTKFIQTWLNSGFISDKIKNESLKRMNNKNYAGACFSGSAYYMVDQYNTLSKTGLIGFFVGIESNYMLSVKFQNDLFRLAFIGNKSFENDTIILNDNKFISLAYDKIGGGIYKRISNENGIALGSVTLNFLITTKYKNIHLKNAELYTAPYAEFINVKANFTSNISDTNAKSFISFNGYGVSTDLFYKFLSYKKLKYYFLIHNLGFIKMNKNSLNLTHDTAFRFDGIELNKVIQNGNMTWNIGNSDSIINSYIPSYKKETFFIPVPCNLSAGLSYPVIKDFFYVYFDLNYILFIPYRPKYKLTAEYKLNKFLKISPAVSYGGFNKINAGIQLSFKNKYLEINTGSDDINGLLLPYKSSGLSAYFSVLFNLQK